MTDSQTPTKPGAAAATANGKTPSTGDAMFFYYIVKNMKTKADIDWTGVAADHGFKNAEVAKVRFGQVKRKLGIGENNTPTKTPGKASNLSTPAKEAKVKKTPAGRTGTKGKKSKKAKEEEAEEEVKSEDAEEKKVKKEEAEDDEAEAQIQADMDKYINTDPEPFF